MGHCRANLLFRTIFIIAVKPPYLIAKTGNKLTFYCRRREKLWADLVRHDYQENVLTKRHYRRDVLILSCRTKNFEVYLPIRLVI